MRWLYYRGGCITEVTITEVTITEVAILLMLLRGG